MVLDSPWVCGYWKGVAVHIVATPALTAAGADSVIHAPMTNITMIFLLLLALTIDYMSIGPTNARDIFAFFLELPCIHYGWNGSTPDVKLTAFLNSGVGQILQSLGVNGSSADIAQMTRAGVKVVIFAVMLYVIGSIVPAKYSAKAGSWAKLSFKCNSRINWKLTSCAIFLGLCGDQLGGLAGAVFMTTVSCVTGVTVGLPELLVGGLS